MVALALPVTYKQRKGFLLSQPFLISMFLLQQNIKESIQTGIKMIYL